MLKLIESIYEIKEVSCWIKQHNCYNIALQFDKNSLHDASSVTKLLKEKTGPDREYYIIISECCGPDYISPLHLGSSVIDTIIKFGNSCLGPLPSTLKELDVLFVFGSYTDQKSFEFVQNYISLLPKSKSYLLFYDTKYYSLVKKLIKENVHHKLEAGHLKSHSNFWHFICAEMIDFHSKNEYAQFNSNFELESYDQVIYIGEKVNLNLRISCKKLTHINLDKKTIQEIKRNKELSKRIKLIECFKQKRELNLGLIFTHLIPCVDWYIEKLQKIKKKNHLLHKIILTQSTDECKLCNFGSLDAFVVINACDCSNLIDTIKLTHLPIISLKEYEIVCRQKVKYGAIFWNLDEENVEDEKEEENEEEQSSEKLNQLMTIDELSKPFWFGLEINPGLSTIEKAEEGQKGIASLYSNEANHV